MSFSRRTAEGQTRTLCFHYIRKASPDFMVFLFVWILCYYVRRFQVHAKCNIPTHVRYVLLGCDIDVLTRQGRENNSCHTGVETRCNSREKFVSSSAHFCGRRARNARAPRSATWMNLVVWRSRLRSSFPRDFCQSVSGTIAAFHPEINQRAERRTHTRPSVRGKSRRESRNTTNDEYFRQTDIYTTYYTKILKNPHPHPCYQLTQLFYFCLQNLSCI